jgi:hypothetical protein
MACLPSRAARGSFHVIVSRNPGLQTGAPASTLMRTLLRLKKRPRCEVTFIHGVQQDVEELMTAQVAQKVIEQLIFIHHSNSNFEFVKSWTFFSDPQCPESENR